METITASPGLVLTDSTLALQISVIRSFGLQDISTAGLVGGWAAPEEAHTWNDGPETVLALTALRPDFRCVLVVEGAPLVGPANPRQDITLYANGLRVGFWRLTSPRQAKLEALIEPGHWRAQGMEGFITLAFHLPNSLRLSTVQPDGDDRELGFCFRTLAIFPDRR